MKTRRHISGGLVLAVAALLCLAGCKKDEEGEKVVLGVDFEQTAGTQKTYIGNSDKTIYWSTDDNVQVNGTNYLVHDGVVEVKLNEDGYAAVYPATGNTLTYSGGTSGRYCTGGTVVIPATQNYTTDVNTGVQKLNAPMAARLDSKTGRLLFRNLYAVVKVTVKAGSSDFTLKSITVESTNGVNLAGTQPFTFSGSTTDVNNIRLGDPRNGSTCVTLMFNTPVTIPANNSASFYLYTVPFSGADLNVRVNGRVDNRTPARTGIAISRSQLRGTTVDVSNLESSIRFSVAEGKYVTFSPGNLQWSAINEGTWRFAEHQWDYVGDKTNGTVKAGDVECDNASISSTYAGWIDLFGWGTSGHNGKYPYETSIDMGYGDGNNDIAGTNYDWGVYNQIGSDPTNTWRTLTNAEWSYLLGTEASTRGGVNSTWWIYNMVTIEKADGTNDVTGLIIYPDGVTEADLSGFTVKANFSQNSQIAAEITKTEFEKLEAMGCVFLPAAGYRYGIDNDVRYAGSFGYYWSSTCNGSDQALGLEFAPGFKAPGIYIPGNVNLSGGASRCYGRSVRLVKDVK